MKLSRFLICIAFLIAIILLHPLYVKQSLYEWFYKIWSGNQSAIINLHNVNIYSIQLPKDNKDIQVIYHENHDKGDRETYADITLPLYGSWKTYNISFKSDNKQKCKIYLKTPDRLENFGYAPTLVDYKFQLNKESKKNITKKSENSAEQDVSYSIIIRKHHLNYNDFKLLFSNLKLISIWHLLGTISILIYCFMLLYNKKYKHLFCTIVFLFLILQFIYLSNDDISKQENRALNKFPSFIINKKINKNFGFEFNSWLSDHFGGRQTLIDLRLLILYKLNNKIANENAFVGDNNWVFPTNGIKTISSEEEQRYTNIEIANALKKINTLLKGKNNQVYVVLEPSRSLLYKENWYKYYPYVPYIDYIEELKNELKGYPNIHLIDLKGDFEKNKNSIQLYEKNDPHMTLSAVNIMLNRIALEMGEDFWGHYKKSIKYKNRKCKLYSFLNFYDDYLKISSSTNEAMCKEIKTKENNIKIINSEIGIREAEVSNPYIKRDLYILFPCYEEFVFPVFGEFFAHTISINYNSFEDYDTVELKNKAVSKLKTLKPNSTVLIFLSYPTEYNISKSRDFLEAY